jgi:hypothetical protein
VAGNSATLGGGGIDNHGRLVLTNSRVTNNSTPVGAVGGGINNHGNLTLVNSLVRGNSASAGGGIFNRKGGRLALTKSTIANNTGGGIYNQGRFTLANSLVTDNSASDEGGGIFNNGNPFADVIGQITNSTVTRNTAVQGGGGIANVQGGRLTIIKSTIAGNSAGVGGGILNEDIARAPASTVTLSNSTVSGNSANSAGGISNASEAGGQITLTNSTVARNSATQEAGGIGQACVVGRIALTNSLVAQNRAPTRPDVDNQNACGTLVLARFSLIGNGSGSGITNTDGNQVGTASAPIDPKLGSLADNGGPTRTHALLLGSPAIDAASTPDCPTTDQRGVLRPQGAACDIGSYERK